MRNVALRIPAWTAIIGMVILFGCNQPKGLQELLNEMTERDNLSYFPEQQYKLKQFSSHNPASVSPATEGWFANEDMSHFLRVEENDGRREFVMFDADGPGTIVRWWMTFYIAQDGIIRLYMDNDSVPSIKGRPDEILSGNALASPPLAVSVHKGVPVNEKGRDMDHNFYLPLPFSTHCKITYECNSLSPTENGNYFPDVFYNIAYREYVPGTTIKSFNKKMLTDARKLIDKTNCELLSDRQIPYEITNFDQEIQPLDSFFLDISRTGQAISYLSLNLSSIDSVQALRSTVFSATFDGIQTVWVPVGDFFGTGYCMVPHRTWMNRTDPEGRMVSEWLMPFQHKCRLKFTNYGKKSIRISGKAGFSDYQWTRRSMYFGASWHEYHHVKTRKDNEPYLDLNFVNIKGKGLYVGDQINLFNTSYEWWGEGDEKIFVDGESFPSSFGTGSEDYYGYAFGRPQSFSHPFLSQPVGNGNEGNTNEGGITVNMRHRSLDAIPFHTSISSNIELWHWADVRINYALTAYWYVMTPFESDIEPDIQAVQRPVALSSDDFQQHP